MKIIIVGQCPTCPFFYCNKGRSECEYYKIELLPTDIRDGIIPDECGLSDLDEDFVLRLSIAAKLDNNGDVDEKS